MSGDGRSLRRDAVRNVEKISAAAMEVFAERGLDVSMADVAERANVGVGTVYRRFGSKRGLISALFDAEAAAITALAETARAEGDPAATLVGLLEGTCEMLAANKGLRQLILTDGMGADAVGGDALDRLIGVVEALVVDAKAAGWLRDSVDATDFPVILVAVQAVRDLTGSADSTLWRRTLRMLIDGIRADSRAPAGVAVPAALTDGEMRALLGSRSRSSA